MKLKVLVNLEHDKIYYPIGSIIEGERAEMLLPSLNLLVEKCHVVILEEIEKIEIPKEFDEFIEKKIESKKKKKLKE